MFARVEGQITGIDFFQPDGEQKKKPHHLIMVMQTDGKKAETIKIKDFNLQARYDIFQTFSSLCTVREWKFNDRVGLSVTVSGGELLLAPGGPSDIPSGGKNKKASDKGLPLDLTDRVE